MISDSPIKDGITRAPLGILVGEKLHSLVTTGTSIALISSSWKWMDQKSNVLRCAPETMNIQLGHLMATR